MTRVFVLLTVLASTVMVWHVTPAAQQPSLVAIENVNIIPMDRERVVAGQNVLVRDGRIAEIGAATAVTPPSGATRADGRGKFLIPALAEMHAHIPVDENAERVLFMYVANGIGTIRSMLGDPVHLTLRDRAAKGEIVAPTMYLSGPSFSGESTPTPQSASARVMEQRKAGYDLLKILPGLSRSAFDATAAAADKAGIRFAGHIPTDVGLDRALEAKYSTIDHLDGYLEALAKPGAPGTELFGIDLVGRLDEAKIPSLVARTKAAGTLIVPTQTLLDNWYGQTDVDVMRAWPEIRYASAAQVEQWTATTRKNTMAYSPEHRRQFLALRRRLIKALHDGGVGILLGSDAPQTWNVPGFSIHRELATYVSAGLTPYEALVTGTRAVAAHLGRLDRTGTVETGKQADLILLDANPLEAISNTTKVSGVMVGGRWWSKAEIDKRLAEGR